MLKFDFVDNHIELRELPKKFKKLSATRFATILGLNKWSTPFEAWCAMTKLYEVPFEGSIYTEAGKVVEAKICEYLRNRFFMDIKSPTDKYGPDYFRKTWGDFFPDVEGLGGMWDFLGDDFVVEVKTTKRVEDWKGEDGTVEPPIYYKLQACLYAYLLGFDDVVMTCSFLEDKDYQKPEDFVPNASNTVVIEFKVSEAFPNFKEDYVDPAMKFWHENVLTGISPEYDEKKDADILKVLRTNKVDPVSTIADISQKKEIEKLIKEAEKLHTYFDKNAEKVAKMKADEKRMKELDGIIKEYLKGQIQDGGKRAEMTGKKFTFICTQVAGKKSLTEDSYRRMKEDGVYDTYVTEEVEKKPDEKAMKSDDVYDTYAEIGQSTYSIKVSPIIEKEV